MPTASAIAVVSPSPSPLSTATAVPVIAPACAAPPLPASAAGAGTQYAICGATGATLVPGTQPVALACATCAAQVPLPFPVMLYGQSFSTALLQPSGQIDFGDAAGATTADPGIGSVYGLPDAHAGAAIFVHWDDLQITGPGLGIFTGLSRDPATGRQALTIEWRASYADSGEVANFAVRFYEGLPWFDLVYGEVDEAGSFATVGVQEGAGSSFTQYECATPDSLSAGLDLTFLPVTPGAATGAIVPPATQAETRSAVAPVAPPIQPDAAMPSNALPPDTDQRHYYAGAGGGPLGLHLYTGPAGIVDSQGWQPRNSTPGAPQPGGAIGPLVASPAHVPFSLQATSGAGTPAQAQITNEDGVSLSVSQVSGSGLQAGQAVGSAHVAHVSFTPSAAAISRGAAPHARGRTGVVRAAAKPAIPILRPGVPASVSLRPTISGLDVRFTLATSQQANAGLDLALTLDPGTRLDSLDSGLLRVSRDITESLPGGGEPVVITQAEYLLGRATATDSNPDPAAPVQAGTTSLSVGSSAVGHAMIMVQVDPAWLHDPHRVFPVSVDVPIVTGSAAADTTWASTVTNCAPTMAAAQAVVVGQEGPCNYHGLLYFDVSSLPWNASIASATLHLYTPATATATGIQIFANSAVSLAAVHEQPTWNDAPGLQSGQAPVPESATAGNWHSWDITNLVRQWVQDSTANGGVTLERNGLPLRIASPFGTSSDPAALAPYLDITYSPSPSSMVQDTAQAGAIQSAAVAAAGDGAASIYGISGSFAAEGPSCTTVTCTAGRLALRAVKQMGASYVRIGVSLACPEHFASGSYWSSHAANADGNNPDLPTLLHQAWVDGLVPVIDFLMPDASVGPNQSTQEPCHPAGSGAGVVLDVGTATREVRDFVATVLKRQYPSGSVYFELGNEIDYHEYSYTANPEVPMGSFNGRPAVFQGSAFNAAYARAFASQAAGLQAAMAGYTNYRILTGSILNPTALPNAAICGATSRQDYQGGTYDNYTIALDALNAALRAGVAATHLGITIHPYHYDTPGNNNPHNGAWQNYYSANNPGGPLSSGLAVYGRNGYAGPCGDLAHTLAIWMAPIQHTYHLPLIFTEDNWTENGGEQGCPRTPETAQSYCEGAYLVDLFSWLYNNGYTDSGSQIRVMWYRGADDGEPGFHLGVYFPHGGQKPLVNLPMCNNPGIERLQSILRSSVSGVYRYLQRGTCYR